MSALRLFSLFAPVGVGHIRPPHPTYLLILINPSLPRAISRAVCIRSSVSIFGPKAFSTRNAISGDSAARPLRSAESAGLVTPRTSAAFVTVGVEHVRPSVARYSANIAANTARTATDCGPVNFPTRFTSRARSTARI